MALNIYEQIIEYIKESRKVVVALEQKISADSLASAYVLSRILAQFKKEYQITLHESPKNYAFITKELSFSSAKDFKQARRLVITLDIAENGLEKFYYTTDEDDKKLEIFVVPKDGFFNPDDVRVGQGGFEYDLVITLGAPDLFSLGNVYQGNTAFFHETPVINIDYKAANEKYGEINLVEPIKSSLSEMLFDFIEANTPELLDKTSATFLLAGILEKTQSFKVPTLAPQTLEKASKLMALDADREMVVRELFYNKSLSLVKLWGRVLARLKEDKQHNIFWSLINTEDFTRAEASPDIIDDVFKEVLSYLPRQAVILLFAEFNNAISVMAYTDDHSVSLEEVLNAYKLEPAEEGVRFKVFNKDILEVEEDIVELFSA